MKSRSLTNSKVAIIILNWNGLKDTIECLESVQKIDYPNYETIVVDNGSSDGSPEKIAKLFPEIILIKNKENLGYAGGNNVGIRHALKNCAECILLLNNDTTVDPQIINAFLEAIKLYPDGGIFGGKIYYHSEPNKIWFAGGKCDNNRGNFLHTGFREPDTKGKYNKMSETEYITGCALFFKKELVPEIGLFDTRFYLYYEDVDWCLRARKKGYKCIFVSKAKLWHKVSASFRNMSTLRTYLIARNRLLVARNNFLFYQKARWYLRVLLSEFFSNTQNTKGYPLIKRLYWDCRSIYRNRKKRELRAKFIGIKDFILGRFSHNRFSLD